MKTMRGFSLVELMVGMLVGLIGTIVIFQVFAVAEGQKRTSTSGGDASQSAAFALFSLERDLRISGQGFNNKGLLGCSIRVYDDEAPAPKSRLIQSLVPARIVPGVGNAPDELSILYSSSDIVNPPSALLSVATANGVIQVDQRGFFQVGDVMVLSYLDGATGGIKVVAGNPYQCTMFRATSLPSGSTQIGHAPAPGTYTANGVTRPIRLNHPGGLDNGLTPAGLSYPAANLGDGGYVFNLGNAPLTAATYLITNGRLIRRDDITNATVEIADGIVQMKVLYGIDANGDNQIATNEWTNTSPTSQVAWQGLRAVKVALVARSALYEKGKSGVCDATTTQPLWYGAGPTGGDITLDVSADSDWKCYRYKVFQTMVPIRNMGWMPFR